MNILCSSSTIFFKRSRCFLAIIISLMGVTSSVTNKADNGQSLIQRISANPQQVLLPMFVVGFVGKSILEDLVDKAADTVVEEASKYVPENLKKGYLQDLASWQIPLASKIVNAAFQIALKMGINRSLAQNGFNAKTASALANAFDAGIKIWSVRKFFTGAVIPTLADTLPESFKFTLKDLFQAFDAEIQRPELRQEIAATLTALKPRLDLTESVYRYSLKYPLASNQGTALTCGAHDPYCLGGAVQFKAPTVSEKDYTTQLYEVSQQLGLALLLTQIGYIFADWAYDIGNIISPHIKNFVTGDATPGTLKALIGDLFGKITQRTSEMEFFAIFNTLLTKLLGTTAMAAQQELDALPEQVKNDPKLLAKYKQKIEKDLSGQVARGLFTVITQKVSGPTEQKFLTDLGLLAHEHAE